jgi:hypothetical protein
MIANYGPETRKRQGEVKKKWLWASLMMEVEGGDELSFRNVSTGKLSVRAKPK